ncbi:carbohydrate ABC transporter permease [Sodalis ligni]|uniref:carbohydrate ABC transporter permease n=1 Tax=Sodalis ligni TaxID=2697027 RepID=UPI00193FC860|nr:carbohydrate ABC transporter permease [Sodalis ligni]QWA10459.1 carbohydrate ABC transporter permease [Sodalis ligni]
MSPSLSRSGLRLVTLLIIVAFFILPLWWTGVSAFRPSEEIFRYLSPISIRTLFPDRATWSQVIALVQSPFLLAIGNSVLVTAVTVIIGLAVCSAAAFALACIEFKGRGVVFAIMVVSFLIPFDAIALPLYQIFHLLRLDNSYTGLVLPGIGNGIAVFLLRQFFLGIPKELSEAAFLDGMGWTAIFLRIYLPLSKPAMIGAGLILFIFQWQSFLWPLLIAPSPQYQMAAVAIAQFSATTGTQWGLIFAGALFTSVIPMLVLVIFQKYFTPSVAAAGNKE